MARSGPAAPKELVESEFQAAAFQALQAVMQHTLISYDVKSVCSLLQTCSSWRAALRQCTDVNLSVEIGSTTAEIRMQGIQKLALFCGWLQRQAGLVQKISVSHPYLENAQERDAYCDAAEQLLVLSLQEAGARPSAATIPTVHPVAALRLREFGTNFIKSAALLRSLPAATLTQLSLNHGSAWRSKLNFNSSSIAGALAQLSSLRNLYLAGDVGNACLAAVGELEHLTRLSIRTESMAAADGYDLQLLPQCLQVLDLSVRSDSSAVRLALGHITALECITLDLSCSVAAGSCLPASLTTATVEVSDADGTADSVRHLDIPGLLQLQWLQACNSTLQQPELLMALAAVTTLECVYLAYDDAVAALRAAPAWQHLSALDALHLKEGHEDDALDPTDSQALLQGLAAATSLTFLSIAGPVLHESVHLCAYLTGLTRLQELELYCEHPRSRADALRLTALTNLTRLDVSDARGIDNTAASALALRLTQLEVLRLAYCGLSSAAALPSIATLTGLTELDLDVRPEDLSVNDDLPLVRDDLLLLAPLIRLRQLSGYGFFSDDAVHELWDERLGKWRQRQQQ